MKTRFTLLGLIAVVVIGITAVFVSCQKELNDIVIYRGEVVYKNTTNPFPNLIVKVTNGTDTHCQTLTNDAGQFSLKVRVNEIDGNYYLLAGDSTCVPKMVALGGYGQAEVNLGTIEVEGPTIPTVTTKGLSNISDNKATSGGNVTSDGRSSVTARGVCWSKSEYPTIDGDHTTNGSGKGEFTSQITGLEPGATYYVRAYATNKHGTAYGDQLTLSTTTGLPQVTTDEVSDISATTAVCGGDLAANSGYPITGRGICWSDMTATPTINNDHTEEVATTGKFSSMMINLKRNTTYYVRAYAINEKGVGYGATKTFTTLNGLPTVTTSEVTDVKTTSALGGGNVTSNGGYVITARGLCWSNSSSTPTVSDSHTNEVADMGTFTSLMTNLAANTTYYVRAYATNEVGTSYGASVTFTTGNGLPTVVTLDPDENITSTSITAIGNVTDDGGFAITRRGFVYSTLPYPTLGNSSNIESGSGTGYFSATISNVSPTENTYYIRAYATNMQGTAYGDQITVTPERASYLSLKTMTYGGFTYRIKFMGEMSWYDGNTAIQNAAIGGYNDWYMPDKIEVQAIITAYGLWQKSSTSKLSLSMDGCTSIWTSDQSYNTGYAYYYHLIDTDATSAYLWTWSLCSSTSASFNEKGNIRAIYAVRKY